MNLSQFIVELKKRVGEGFTKDDAQYAERVYHRKDGLVLSLVHLCVKVRILKRQFKRVLGLTKK